MNQIVCSVAMLDLVRGAELVDGKVGYGGVAFVSPRDSDLISQAKSCLSSEKGGGVEGTEGRTEER